MTVPGPHVEPPLGTDVAGHQIGATPVRGVVGGEDELESLTVRAVVEVAVIEVETLEREPGVLEDVVA